MTWTWNLSLICSISKARCLTKESLASRWKWHINTWNGSLRPLSLLIDSIFRLIVTWAHVSLILVGSLISKSFSITIETEVRASSDGSCLPFRLEVREQGITWPRLNLLLHHICDGVCSIIILHNRLFYDVLRCQIGLSFYQRNKHRRTPLYISLVLLS